jgi:peptide/nickel transport system substrate-binding protein
LKRREFAKLAALGIAGTALPAGLASCAPTTTPAPGTTPVGASPKPVTPKVLTYGSVQELSSADPAVSGINMTTEGHALKTLYDPLFKFVGNPPRLVPVLAQSMDVSPDGRQYTVRLVRNARFQDGSPVTSEAVKFSLQRVIRVARGASIYWRGVVDPEATTTPDEYTVVIKLLRPFAPFPQTLPALMIQNPKVVRENAGTDDSVSWLQRNGAGSGPFKLTEFRPGEQYVFQADPNYWGGWRPNRLSGYVWRIIREPSAAIIALKRNEIQIMPSPPTQDAELLKAEPGIKIENQPGLTVHRIVLHNQNPRGYTADPNVRRALTHAFNAPELIKYYQGYARAAVGPLPPGLVGHDPTLQLHEYDLQKAKAALARSRWPNGGFELEFLLPAGRQDARDIGLLLLEGAKAINITVKITEVASSNFVARRAKPDTMPDSLNLWLTGTYPDPDAYLYNQYYSGNAGAGNFSYYKNEEVDRLLLQARESTDQQARLNIYKRVQQIIVDEDVDIVTSILNPVVAMRTSVKGYEYMPYESQAPLATDLWIED